MSKSGEDDPQGGTDGRGGTGRQSSANPALSTRRPARRPRRSWGRTATTRSARYGWKTHKRVYIVGHARQLANQQKLRLIPLLFYFVDWLITQKLYTHIIPSNWYFPIVNIYLGYLRNSTPSNRAFRRSVSRIFSCRLKTIILRWCSREASCWNERQKYIGSRQRNRRTRRVCLGTLAHTWNTVPNHRHTGLCANCLF